MCTRSKGLVRLRLIDLGHPLQGVDLTYRLVVANAQNTRETQGEPAVMPIRSHYVVKRDLQNYQWLDRPDASEILQRVLQKELG